MYAVGYFKISMFTITVYIYTVQFFKLYFFPFTGLFYEIKTDQGKFKTAQ